MAHCFKEKGTLRFITGLARKGQSEQVVIKKKKEQALSLNPSGFLSHYVMSPFTCTPTRRTSAMF